jgi:glycosyltransferase involved in cell wall biosynthesis
VKTAFNLVIDGIIFSLQPYGGISRIYKEIIPRICAMDSSIRVTLLIQGEVRSSLPVLPNIFLIKIPELKTRMRPYSFWQSIFGLSRNFIIKAKLHKIERPIWHSTYYTTTGRWNGPSVVTVYDMIYERFPQFYNSKGQESLRKRKRRCIEGADAIICISETTRQDAESYYDCKGKSMYVTPLGYSAAFKKLDELQSGEQRNKPFLLYVGRRAHYKNFTTLLKAYQTWKYAGDFEILAVGDPWSAEEQDLIASLGIQDSVHAIQVGSDEELCRLYNQAAAFVYPSLYEGFGIPLLEAMACSCPVVASNIPSTVEVAGDYPYYFEPTSRESLAEALTKAVMENRDAKRMLYGFERIKSFSWDRTARETLEVYRSFQS